jgi:CheY-like chemotaxis protein
MGAKPKVLVVDDTLQVREFYRLLLRKMDCTPVTAQNGEEALKFLANAAEPFSLIILDLLMPGKTGWETMLQIRAMEGYENVPVIVITGMDLPQDQVDRLKEQCQEVFPKNEFSLARVKELLGRYLPRRGTPA